MAKFTVAQIKKSDPHIYGISQKILKKIEKVKRHSFKESLQGRLLAAKLAKISRKDLEDFLLSSLRSFYYKKYGIFWSISHKKNWIAAAVSRRPIGIDIEFNRKISKSAFDFFTNSEWHIIGVKNLANFYKAWTAKEASLKTLSLGMDKFKEIIIYKKKENNFFLKYHATTLKSKVTSKRGVILAISSQNTGS